MAAGTRPAPAWDPVLTVGLLLFGLVRATDAVAQARVFDQTMAGLFTQLGLGDWMHTGLADAAGVVLVVVNTVCLVLAIGFSVPRIRQHRTAFWIPLVCGVIAGLVTLGVTVGVACAEPAFVARLFSTG